MAKKMRADCLYERETTIVYNELESDCLVYTCNKKLQRAIERMGVKPDAKDHVGRKYHFPKSWLQPPVKPKVKVSVKVSVKTSVKKEVKKDGKKDTRGANRGKLDRNIPGQSGPTKGGKAASRHRVSIRGNKGAGRGKDSVRQTQEKARAHVQPDRVLRGQLHKTPKAGPAAVKKADLRKAGRR
ncbi:MAG: hypothetical protein WC455_13325 [Dehalococcoidia bacterium]